MDIYLMCQRLSLDDIPDRDAADPCPDDWEATCSVLATLPEESSHMHGSPLDFGSEQSRADEWQVLEDLMSI